MYRPLFFVGIIIFLVLSSVSVISTTTTTITGGINPDTNGDGCVDLNEIIAFIELWKGGQATTLELINAIELWKQGCTTTTTIVTTTTIPTTTVSTTTTTIDCMTIQEVQNERSDCLYIYQNNVFRKGSYPNKHQGHTCGTDITVAMQSELFHTDYPDIYLWPYLFKPLCV